MYKHLWYTDFYDYPREGFVEKEGEYFYYVCKGEYLVDSDSEVETNDERYYVLYKITKDEFKFCDETNDIFIEFVYNKDKTDWTKYYDSMERQYYKLFIQDDVLHRVEFAKLAYSEINY